MKKSLASKLKNRIYIYRNTFVEGKLGDEYEPKLLKTVWANIIPLNGKVKNEEGETQSLEKKFKIIIRKTEINDQTDYIVFKEQKYDIGFIIPDFRSNSFLEVYVALRID